MQKKGNYLILVLVLFLTFNVKNTYASEVNLTSSKNNANVGENIKVKVSFTAAGWNLVVKDNNNTIDNIAGVNPDGNNELVTKEYTIDTSAIGTHTITVSGDITELESGLSYAEFEGDYQFDKFLSEGGAESDMSVIAFLGKNMLGDITGGLGGDNFGCSAFSAKSENGYYFGRNFDWYNCDALVVITHPDSGYS